MEAGKDRQKKSPMNTADSFWKLEKNRKTKI